MTNFWRFLGLHFQRAACSTFQTCILNSHYRATPCISMIVIQSATAENRRGIKKRRNKQDKNIMSASATHGGHKNCRFTARRNARIASAVLAMAFPSVCLSVRPSGTHRYCVETTAGSTVLFALSDSKMCLVLYRPKIFHRDDPFPLKSWLK